VISRDLTKANSPPRAQAGAEADAYNDSPVPHVLTPLTGRDTEVSLLRDRWEQAQEGMGQVVSIVGEAGLGKSRLVRTIKEIVLAEVGSDAAESRCPSPLIEWRCSARLPGTGLFSIT